MEAQREVTNMTNELLKKNADALKMGTIETAKESERGIVDIETLKYRSEERRVGKECRSRWSPYH